jgi:hypothetical protein
MPRIEGERLRELRRARGWDVPEMARRLRQAGADGHVPAHDSMVRMAYRWERVGLTIERYELLYARALGIAPEDLAAGPLPSLVLSLSPIDDGGEGDDPVNRREFSLGALGLLAGTLVPSAGIPESVSPEHVDILQRAAAELWTRDRQVGGTALLREATRHYAVARAMLDSSSYTSAVGNGLQAVTTELAACAGFAAYDADDQATARAMLIEAALLAIGNPLLAARAWSLLAMQSGALAAAGDTGRAREALRFLGQAESAARHEPSPRLHASIWMRRATTSAMLGDETAVRASITAARRELDRGDHPADPRWTGYVTWSEVTAHDGTAMLRSGRPGHAARLFREVLADPGLPPRNRALYQAQLAASLAADGERAEAVAEGVRALPALEGPVKSARAIKALRPVRQQAARDGEFAVRFDAIAAS